MQKLTNEQYAAIAARHAEKSRTAADTLRAFAFGGLVCVLGELIARLWLAAGAGDNAGTAASMTLIFLSAMATGLGIYDEFAKIAGAGALVPITGFANAVASPALEFKTEGLVSGLAAKMFTIAGPVLVYGTLASILYGLLLSLL